MSEENKYFWDVAFRGMQRFFDEGLTIWPKDKFFLLFPSRDVAQSDFVFKQLKDLESKGSIELVGSDDVYVRVINI